MTQKELEGCFKYIRTVTSSSINEVEYQNIITYFETSRKSELLTKFQLYFEAIVKENRELRFKLSKETSKRLLLESDLSVCKKELDAAVSRVLELSK